MESTEKINVASGSEKLSLCGNALILHSFILTASRGRLLWLHLEMQMYRSLLGNRPTSPLIYYLNEHFTTDLLVLIIF